MMSGSSLSSVVLALADLTSGCKRMARNCAQQNVAAGQLVCRTHTLESVPPLGTPFRGVYDGLLEISHQQPTIVEHLHGSRMVLCLQFQSTSPEKFISWINPVSLHVTKKRRLPMSADPVKLVLPGKLTGAAAAAPFASNN